MRRVQVFDVNETLLDLAAMDPHFQRIFGDGGARVAWFNQIIQSALVATVTGAARAGCATAFVARPGEVLDPLVERPEIVGADLTEVDAILAVDRG